MGQIPAILTDAELTAYHVDDFERLDLPTFEETNQKTLDYLRDLCRVCSHPRYTHGIHHCMAGSCKCQVHYMDIPRRTK